MMFCFFISAIFNELQDRTHPPEYYNPEFDVKIDHGTVCDVFLVDIKTLIRVVISRAIHL